MKHLKISKQYVNLRNELRRQRAHEFHSLTDIARIQRPLGGRIDQVHTSGELSGHCRRSEFTRGDLTS